MKDECLFTVEVDSDLLEEVEDILGPMGWTAEEYLQAIIEFLANPANEKIITEQVNKWRQEGLL